MRTDELQTGELLDTHVALNQEQQENYLTDIFNTLLGDFLCTSNVNGSYTTMFFIEVSKVFFSELQTVFVKFRGSEDHNYLPSNDCRGAERFLQQTVGHYAMCTRVTHSSRTTVLTFIFKIKLNGAASLVSI